jgi:hypothetical protein
MFELSGLMADKRLMIILYNKKSMEILWYENAVHTVIYPVKKY